MSELSEVEKIRRQLAQKIIDKKINDQKIIGQLIFSKKPLRHTRKVFDF